jgi:hypothetical protein
MPIEQFVRHSDNQIKITLTEDDEAVSGAWDSLDIWIGSVNIHRDDSADGVTFSTSTGLLTITPADLTSDEQDDLDALSAKRSYLVRIVVTTALNDDGAVWGGVGSEKIIFTISDKPSTNP